MLPTELPLAVWRMRRGALALGIVWESRRGLRCYYYSWLYGAFNLFLLIWSYDQASAWNGLTEPCDSMGRIWPHASRATERSAGL
jgi:hypothetical protein